MASTSGEETDHLIARLVAEPFGFNFFRAVRLLESHFRDAPPIGTSQRLKDDWIRFGQKPSLAFAPSSVDHFDAPNEGPKRMFVQFLGLLGPNGPLPAHVTEFIIGRIIGAKDHTHARFLDVFNHRFVSLFYRAWAAAQKSADYDRPEQSRFAAYIGSLFGVGMKSLLDRDAVPDRAKLYFSGRLACQTRNAEGLHAILEGFFGIRTIIEEFSGFWMRIPGENQCRLGESPHTGSIGRNAIAGERKYETQLKFRIRMGPMKLRDLERMLPGGDSFKRLRAWVLNYVGYELKWDVQCVIEAAEVPSACLGKMGRLGLSCWTKSRAPEKDAEDPIFDPENYP
ncbi:MAG: type VI secretion system baseplate subunit TssG [Chthoniobacteraceae bacterium]